MIELLTSVAIVGIVSAIAYPSYVQQVSKSRRSECAGTITSLANAMERHHTINGTYTGAAEGGDDTGPPAIYSAQCPVDGGTPNYQLSIEAATGSTYVLQATPTGPQVGDKCGSMTLNNSGRKGIADAETGVSWEECWR